MGLSAAATWRSVLGQGTSPVGALSRPRSKRVPGWILIVCVFEIISSAVIAAELYAPQGVEVVLERTGPISRETSAKATIIQPLAASGLSAPYRKKKHLTS